METRTCLVCGGSGFETRWQSSSDMEDWHNGACEECHGFGYVMVSDHNEESVMESREKSGEILIDDGDDGWY